MSSKTERPPGTRVAIERILSARWPAALWLLTLAAAALWSAATLLRGYSFDSSVLALLPSDSARPAEGADVALLERADAHLAQLASQRMVFLVSHPDAEVSSGAAESFASHLRASGLFADVQARLDGASASEWQRTFFPYRYRLLTSQDRHRLSDIAPGPNHPLLTQALARLYSPMASTVAATLVEDPLQLFFNWQLQAAPAGGFALDQGWLSRREGDRHYRLLSVVLAADPFSLAYQQAVTGALTEAQADLPAGAQVLSSGLLRHAAYGAAQARREISTIGLGSMLGIALLLVYCFRRPGHLLLALLPVAGGWLFAAALSMLVFERLHLITLAFGASLIGVAVDYSLHYLCAREELPRASVAAGEGAVIARIFPGLSLGLISSALAYAAQGAAPFPGLRQMAFFSVCGLLGAWLTVVLLLPRLAPAARSSSALPLHRLASQLQTLLQHWPRASSRPVAAVLVLLAGAGVYQLGAIEFADDIRHLQTSPPELLAEDARVQALTGGVNPAQYFLLSADRVQDLLALEERLQPALDAMVASGHLADYQAISRWVPSRQRQEESRALNAAKVYAPDGLAAMLATRIGAPGLADQMAKAFANDATGLLDIDTWLSSEAGKQQRFLWLEGFDGRVHSLILLSGIAGPAVLGELSSLARAQADVWWVDKVASLSTVLQTNRQQLQLWILAAYLVVFALLSWRYGLGAWRIVSPPAIASLSTLAILSAAGWSITIFNLLALLLVLGIGLDAGIFLRENARSHYTWAAVSLAACTTLLAFGLLALSATPVLQQFGITVLSGIIIVWLLAPCFVEAETEAAG